MAVCFPLRQTRRRRCCRAAPAASSPVSVLCRFKVFFPTSNTCVLWSFWWGVREECCYFEFLFVLVSSYIALSFLLLAAACCLREQLMWRRRRRRSWRRRQQTLKVRVSLSGYVHLPLWLRYPSICASAHLLCSQEKQPISTRKAAPNLHSFTLQQGRQSEGETRPQQDMRIDYLKQCACLSLASPPPLTPSLSAPLSSPRWPVNTPSVTVCLPLDMKKRVDGWGGRMQARKRASEAGGLTLQLFRFSSPPSYICGVAPSLTLSHWLMFLSHLKHIIHSLPHPPLFTTHTLLPSFAVFSKIVFFSLWLELQLDAFLFPSPSL